MCLFLQCGVKMIIEEGLNWQWQYKKSLNNIAIIFPTNLCFISTFLGHQVCCISMSFSSPLTFGHFCIYVYLWLALSVHVSVTEIATLCLTWLLWWPVCFLLAFPLNNKLPESPEYKNFSLYKYAVSADTFLQVSFSSKICVCYT